LFNFTGDAAMKRSILFAALTVAALSAPAAFAQDTKPTPAKPAMGMDMDKHMSQMQEKMKAMQAQMDTIRNTTDPKKRQKLMQEHMQAMQENMKMMRGMGGPMMMGGQKGGGMMGGDPKQRQEMMEKRMDMMQMMMEQMMQHDQAMESMPAK